VVAATRKAHGMAIGVATHFMTRICVIHNGPMYGER
jgi:hypothetical protein